MTENAKNNFDVNHLEKLKGNEQVSQDDLKVLKAVLDNKDDLFKSFFWTRLEKNVQKKMGEIFKDLNVSRIEGLLKGDQLSVEEKNNLMLLLDKYKEAENEKAKDLEIQAMIQRVRVELQYFQGQVMEQSAYKAQNLREKSPQESSDQQKTPSGEKSPESQPTSTGNGEISEIELDNLEKFLGGKDILTDKLTRVEKSLKSDFMKMVELLNKKTSLTKLLQTLNAQMKNNVAMPDWKTLFPKSNGEKYSEKDIKNLQKGYQAYLESKTSNPDLSRWNQILNLLETGVLNEGKSLDTIRTESLNKPISKKERKQGLLDEQWRWRTELAKDGKANEWKTNYMQTHHDEIHAMQQAWLEDGYSGSQITKMTKDYLDDQFDAYTKKEWKKHLKEQEKNWIQKSDLGKFRVLVDSLAAKSDQEKVLALMTDTNFDGMRNHLDGKGTKRGSQIDAAFHRALESGKTPEEIVKNIGAFMAIRMPGLKVPTDSVKDFVAWLSADIKNARAVQSALMDSPAQSVDIMTHGKDALKKTLEKNKFSPEDLQKIQTKIDTDPATKDLPVATKAEVMSSVSSYLLSKMQEKGANANVNGLGVGVNVPLSQILEGLSFTAGTGTSFDGGLFAGIGLAWNTKIASWETGSVDAGLKAGTTLGVIPIYGLRAGFEQDLNTKQVLGDLDPTALKSVSFGANMTMIGAMPSWGLNAGFDADKLKGIEKQYHNIKKNWLEMMTDLLKTDKSLDAVKAYLSKKYPKSAEADLTKAAENLASASKLADGLDQKAAAKVIADWYAESWRNTAIQGLPKGRKPTGAGLGIQFLAGFFPVGSLSMTLTKYKNESHEDSRESKQQLRQRENLGLGNETKNKVEKSDFNTISIALQRANILASGEKIEMSDDGKVALPVALLNKAGLEVRIADRLKGFVKQNGNALIVPANIDWRFLQASRTNGSRAVLNIGGNKNEGMKPLNAQNLKDYLGERDYSVEQQKNQISSGLEAMKAKNPELKDLRVTFENNQISFFNGEEKVGPYELWKPLDQEFAVGNGGKFTIKLYQTGGVDVQRESSSSGKFVEFVYDKAGDAKKLDLQVSNNLLESLRDANSDLVKGLSKLDDRKLTALNGFLANTNATKADYEKAITELKAIIPNKEPYVELWKFLDTTIFWTGTTAVEGKGLSNIALKLTNDLAVSRYLIIDRLKAIFATESRIQDVNSMRTVVNSRNNAYQKLAWPNGKTLAALNIDSKAFAKTIENTDRVAMPGLVGFTAFYRRGTNEGRGLSLTGLGETNVLGNKLQKLTGDQESFAKEWFFGSDGQSGNLDKYSAQKALLMRKVREVAGNQNLSNTQVEGLLKWESIDIWDKIYKLDADYVFYLMGECANESIGLNINGIKVLDKVNGHSSDQGSMTFNTSETDAQAHVQASQVNLGVVGGGGGKGDDWGKTTPDSDSPWKTIPGSKDNNDPNINDNTNVKPTDDNDF